MAAARLLRPSSAVLLLLLLFAVSLTSSQVIPPPINPEPDLLLQLKRSLTNSDAALASWRPDTPPCGAATGEKEWKGLRCKNGAVIIIRLEDMELSGDIDVEALEQLPYLRSLSFANNSFAGPIPDFNRLAALRSLFLSANRFSGKIPANHFENLRTLRKLFLDRNLFTGNIPESIAKLNHVIELHLDNNQFSGPIPALEQKTLIDLDLSNNRLEGEIPAAMDRFDAEVFAGNEDLCGEKLGKKCKKEEEPPPKKPDADGDNKHTKKADFDGGEPAGERKDTTMFIAAVATLAVMVLFLLIVLIMRKVRGKEQTAPPPRGRPSDTVEVNVAGGAAAAGSSSGDSGVPSGSGSSLGAAAGKRRMTGDLVMLNDEKGTFGMPDLMKASAEILGNAGVGPTYKAVMANGVAVVVKRMRDNDGKEKGEFDAEAKRLGGLRHANILGPLSYYYKNDEKLFVYEYVSKGSLFYQLHGDHGGLKWPDRLKIVKGIARGLSYLHKELSHSLLPHGNIKSSNVLLGSNYDPLLSEFGYFPLFGPQVAAQMLIAYKSPEAIQHGEVSPKSDVFCLGILILEILSGKLPSLATNGTGGTDLVEWVGSKGKLTEVLDPDIASSTNSTSDMENLVKIAKDCIRISPDDRLDMEEALKRIESIQT